jgi:flagellar protein FlaF
MNQAASAYARVARTGLSARALEAAVLSQCANRLTAALDAADPVRDLIAALDENRKLWAVFARALRAGDTDLPDADRHALGTAVDFVAARTIGLLQQLPDTLDRARVQDLVVINRTIAAGLRGEAA